MQAIASITPSGAAPAACSRLAQCAQQDGTAGDRPQPGSALVLAEPYRGTVVEPTGTRPSAVFLAQLIATAQRAPQTRRRRRAEPDQVTTIYAAVSAPAAPIGLAFADPRDANPSEGLSRA